MLLPFDAKLMKRDFHRLLASAEAVKVTLEYRVALDPSVTDPLYGHTTSNDTELEEIKTTAIQKIVGPRDKELLDWGVLNVGDCVLYLSEEIDLSEASQEHTIFKIDGLEWIPVPEHDLKESKNYAVFRIHFGAIGQVIPCKRRPLV